MQNISKILKAFFLALVYFGVVVNTSAQKKMHHRSESLIDLATSIGSGTFSSALSWNKSHRLSTKIPALSVGYGIRATTFIAANKHYVTAPSKFTSPVQNLATIFSKTIQENIDTITTATAFTTSINLALYLQYALSSRVDLGFNIDAVGFSFGPKKKFNVISSVFDPNQSPVVAGSPTRLNLLLTSDNDIGSLNSEFYFRYWFNEKIGLRAGYTFLFSEYQLDSKLSFDNGRIVNDRYRYKASMFLLALSYKLH